MNSKMAIIERLCVLYHFDIGLRFDKIKGLRVDIESLTRFLLDFKVFQGQGIKK